MTPQNAKMDFLAAAREWICDSYSVDCKFIVVNQGDCPYLSEAVISINPLPSPEDLNFLVDVPGLLAGQFRSNNQTYLQIIELLKRAILGSICIFERSYSLPSGPVDFSSEMTGGERWFADLHLQVSGPPAVIGPNLNFYAVESALRLNNPPFDGLPDLTHWLGITDPRLFHIPPSIKIRVGPPVDLMTDERSQLREDELELELHAHPNFDLTKVRAAVRGVPGGGLTGRKQISSEIRWDKSPRNHMIGSAKIKMPDSESAMVMLMIGQTTVRRQWFHDPVKARSRPFVAMQLFDNNLRQMRQAVFESTDSVRFEKGIGALLFLLGFASALQIETDAPDIVVTTPGGKIAIVECTLKVADISSKIGKLVDRSRALSRTLESSGHYSPVFAALVCALPKDQIAISTDQLETHKIILVAREDLTSAFERLRLPTDPDKLLEATGIRSVQNDLANEATSAKF
jgi:hypothetical protein